MAALQHQRDCQLSQVEYKLDSSCSSRSHNHRLATTVARKDICQRTVGQVDADVAEREVEKDDGR